MDGSRVLHEDDHPDVYAQVRAMHEAVNAALGIADCATHMEVFLGPDDQLVFSEIATRAGGAWIPDLLTTRLGYSVWRALAHGLVDGLVEPVRAEEDLHVGTVSIHPSEPGVVQQMPGPDELVELPGVVSWRHLKHAGDRARVNHPSEYYLHVVVTAGSEDELVARCRHVVANARVVTAEPTPARSPASKA